MSFDAHTPAMYSFKPFVFDQHKVTRRELLRKKTDPKVCCDDKYLYSYATYNVDPDDKGLGDWYVELWKFNLLTHKWMEIRDSRSQLLDNSFEVGTVFEDGKILICCEVDTPPTYFYLLHWDLKINELEIERINRSLPAMDHDQKFVNDDTYLYGLGSRGIVKNKKKKGKPVYLDSFNVHRMKIKSGKWKNLYLCPDSDPNDWDSDEFGHIFAFDGKIIYVLDNDESSREPLKPTRILSFDLETKQWDEMEVQRDLESKPGIPFDRGDYSIIQYKDEKGDMNVILAGGETDKFLCNDIWRLNLKTLQWTCVSKFAGVLPYRIRNHVAAITPAGKMYLVDGWVVEKRGEVENSTIFSTWVTIPKLTEIAWEAVLFYNKDLKEKSQTELVDLGLPSKLIDRLVD